MTDTIKTFWDNYETHGINEALNQVRAASENDDLKALEEAVPTLVAEARDREIDIIQFLSELDDSLAAEEAEVQGDADASGTDNGDRGISSVSSDEADQPQDEDESESARDADGEDRS